MNQYIKKYLRIITFLLAFVVLFLITARLNQTQAYVTIDSSVSTTSTEHLGSSSTTVFISDTVGYAFFVDSTGDGRYRKTSNGGTTWAAATALFDAQTDILEINVWYDQWTPGDAGTYIHIMSADGADVFYTRLNTSGDTLTTTVNATSTNQAGGFTAGENIGSITKATDGDLYMGIQDDADSFVIRCASASDCTTLAGWAETASNPFDLALDHLVLMPLASGNIMAIRFDISANDYQSKIYTDSGTPSWAGSWTNIDTNAIENATYDGHFGATLDTDNNNIYLAYAADNGTLGVEDDDIRTAVYNGSWDANTTDVLTNSPLGITDVKIAYDQNNDDIYVTYAARSSPGIAATNNIYWQKSIDGMTSWIGPQGPAHTSDHGDIYGARVNIMSADRLCITWYEAALDDLFSEIIADLASSTDIISVGVGSSAFQTPEIVLPATNQYIGAFTFIRDGSTANVTQIILNEEGSVNANSYITNLDIRYEQAVNCSYDGTETLFGTASSFDASDQATVTGTMSVGTSQICVYVAIDASNSSATNSTFKIEISNPSTDITVSAGSIIQKSRVLIKGATSLRTTTLPEPIAIDSNVSSNNLTQMNSSTNNVFISNKIGYTFYIDSTGTGVYSKTSDGGETWNAALTLDSQTDVQGMAVWYDQWTPGDTTGTYIHIATIDSGNDTSWYARLNTNGDSVDTASLTVADQGASLAAGTNNVAITKATDGKLYISVADDLDSWVHTCNPGAIACTTGTNWSEIANPYDAGIDFSSLMPLASANVMLIRYDVSTNNYDYQTWNGSAWTGSWSTIATAVGENTTYDPHYGLALNKSNNYIYLAYVDDSSTLGTDDDIETYYYVPGSGWSSRGNILTNDSKGIMKIALSIDQHTNDVYALYAARTAPGLAETGKIYLKKSTDSMSNWGSETEMTKNVETSITSISTSMLSYGRIYGVWYDDVYQQLDGYTFGEIAITVSGTTNISTGSIAIAVNNSLQVGTTSPISTGTWEINTVARPTGDKIVTAWVSEAGVTDESTAVTKYDDSGPITGMVLNAHALSIGSTDNQSLTVSNLGLYDNDDDEDIMHSANSTTLNVDDDTAYDDEKIDVLLGSTLTIGGTEALITHDLAINGTLTSGGNSVYVVMGSWDNNNTFNCSTSTVGLVASSGTETIDSTGATTSTFNNLTLGNGSGTATWNLNSALDVDSNLTIAYGTLAMNGSNNINLAGNLAIGDSYSWDRGHYTKGTGTFTFDGAGTSTWANVNSSNYSSDMGMVNIDGSSKTVNLDSSYILATKLTVGTDDTLGLGNSANQLTLTGSGTGTNRPFIINPGGTLNEGNSTIIFNTDTGPTEIQAETYYSLYLQPNNLGNPTYILGTANSQTINISGSLGVGDGTNPVTIDWDTYDPALNVSGDWFELYNGSTWIKSNSATLTFNGNSLTQFGDYNTVSQDLGTVVVDGTSKSVTASGAKLTTLNIGANDTLDISNASLTITGSGTPFIIESGGTFTTTNSKVTYVGSSNTNINTTAYYDLSLIPSSGTPTYSLTDHLTGGNTMGGDLSIGSGATLTTTASNYNLTLGGSWSNNGTFTSNSSTTTFNASDKDFLTTKNEVLSSIKLAHSCTENSSTHKIYCFGGLDMINSVMSDEIIEYDPATDSLVTKTAVLPNGLYGLSCAENSATNKIYCFGGLNPWVPPAVFDEIIEYDPATDSLVTKTAVLPTGRYGLSCAENSATNKIYCSGGLDMSNILDEIVEYNPATDSLVTKTAVLPIANSFQSCAENSSTNKIYCFGGNDNNGNSFDEIVEYNPATDSLVTKTAILPTNRYALSCAENSATNKIYCSGGSDDNMNFLNEIVEYNPATDSLVTKSETLPTVNFALACAQNSATNKIYCLGGTSYNITEYDSESGKPIEAGSSPFYDVAFNSSTGGWRIQTDNLTAAHNLTITDTAASGFIVDNVDVEIQGAYSIADAETANTTWTNSTLYLNSASAYTIGSKTQTAETYDTLQIGANTDIRLWNSTANTFTVNASGSLYSQDHANTNGDVYAWGDYHCQTNDYWSYETDFDGTDISGSPRQVDVKIDPASSITVDNGDTLATIGTSANRTTVSRQGSSNGYVLTVASGGTINSQYTNFDYLDGNKGLDIQAGATVTSLDYTKFDNLIGTTNTDDAFITVASSVIGSGTKIISGTQFDNTGSGAEFNVNRTGSDDTGYWNFVTSTGAFNGETYDGANGVNEADPGMLKWDDSNKNPTAATDLLTEGTTNPTNVIDETPEFSAIYNDLDVGDSANAYQIQVDDDSGFGSPIWDSTKTILSINCPQGGRCNDISYSGPSLAEGTQYYWQIKYWDDGNLEGVWNTGSNYFIINQTPIAPTSLLTEELTNPTNIINETPEFSAIYNDLDIGDTTNAYQIQVDDDSGFGSPIWDSGQQPISSCVQGNRCEKIVYSGSTLNRGITYYWRIKYWDDSGKEGSWSTESAYFSISIIINNIMVDDLQLDGMIIDPNW